MTTAEELETVVESPTQEEFSRFPLWFLDRDWEKWDREIEEDSKADRLGFLIQEAIALWIETAREFGDPVTEAKGCRPIYA